MTMQNFKNYLWFVCTSILMYISLTGSSIAQTANLNAHTHNLTDTFHQHTYNAPSAPTDHQRIQNQTAFQPQLPIDNGWKFEFAPYLWMSGLNGDITVRGMTNHVNITFSEILRHLDFGAQGHVEANYNRWTLMVDGNYLKLSDDLTTQVGRLGIDITLKAVLLDEGVFYRIVSFPGSITTNWGDSNISIPLITIELLAAGRYFMTSSTLKLNDNSTLSNSNHSLSPIVGARLKYNFTPRTQFWTRADFGGFHIDGMEKTWSATAGLAYMIKRHIDVGIAYRVLKIDYVKNSNRSAIDVLLYGPMLGVAVWW